MLQIQPHESHGADLSLVQPLRGIPPLMTPPTKSMYRGIALRLASLPDVRKPDVLLLHLRTRTRLGTTGVVNYAYWRGLSGFYSAALPKGPPGSTKGFRC